MSKVTNEPKYKNPLLQAIRAQLEHRAFWLYLLCDEAQKRGLDPRDFGSAAVRRCGLTHGADLVKCFVGGFMIKQGKWIRNLTEH